MEDFATDEVLEQLGIGSPYELLGLYHGVSLNHKSVMDLPRQPDMVFLYRRPILEEWADSGEALGDLITHVLVHEIGHHFGFSDDDMERIEATAGTLSRTAIQEVAVGRVLAASCLRAKSAPCLDAKPKHRGTTHKRHEDDAPRIPPVGLGA